MGILSMCGSLLELENTMYKTRIPLLLLLLALAGCNTVQGVGKDVQRAGSAIERAANK